MIRRSREIPVEAPKVSLKVHRLDILQFVQMIETQPGFAFARLSDGGFFCMQGRKGYNCDGVVYTKAQADSLFSVILDPNITHGITSIALHTAKAAEWLAEKGIDIEWYDADVMNKASDEGLLYPFIACLRKRRSMVVGASHLDKLKGFPITNHVVCHASQAFEEVDALEAEIIFRVERHAPDTILLCAGQGASPTLVSRLHKEYSELVIIDAGSLFDPYVGVLSRSGHKRRGLEEYKKLGWKNFKEDISQW